MLQTKLYIPPIRPLLVPRPHLVEKLNACLTCKLTLVSAPPGFGKTTLVTSWIDQVSDEQLPGIGWLSLDSEDNDPARFLTYLIAAMRQALDDPQFGDIVLNAFSSPQPLPLPSILTLLLNGLTAVSLPILLILDDYHEIEAEPIHEMMRFLLEHLPASVHFLLTTRVDPPFPLPRLRLRGQLTEIRTDALRFSQAETAVFLQQTIPLSLSAQAVQTLEQRTEGWIAALHAAALALQSQTTSETAQQLINTFSGTHRYIMDYLAEELLRQQSSAVQTFLLQTSILEQFCLPLCVAVTGEDRETAVSLLTHLEQNNLFLIPLDHERKWYRYHHLFRDFLRGQLATRDMKPRTLHARAAAWFGIQKMASAAISHWVQAAENKHALDLIESESMLVLMRGELATYHRWIAPFTQAELEQRPRLCLLQAWMVLISGDLEMAEIWLTKTETALADHQSVVDLDELKGQILTARTTIAASKRDIVHTIAYAEEALTRLPSTQTNFRALVNWNLAFAHRLQGNWKQSAALYRNAVRMAKASGNRVTAVFALSGLAHLLTHNSKFIEAETVFLQAIEMSSDADKRPLPIVSEPFVGYANLLRLQNRLDEAEKYAHIAIEMSEQLQHWDLMAISIVELGVIQYNQGHLNQAQARYETAVNLAATHQLIRSQDKISQLATLLNPPPPQMVETAVDALSDRELEVLHLVAAGYTNQQIADKLVVALSTAKWHIRNIYSKLHVENRTQAVATARHRNLID